MPHRTLPDDLGKAVGFMLAAFVVTAAPATAYDEATTPAVLTAAEIPGGGALLRAEQPASRALATVQPAGLDAGQVDRMQGLTDLRRWQARMVRPCARSGKRMTC